MVLVNMYKISVTNVEVTVHCKIPASTNYRQYNLVFNLSDAAYNWFMTMTMTMTIFYSTIDIQIEIIMYNSLENQIINWSGDYY